MIVRLAIPAFAAAFALLHSAATATASSYRAFSCDTADVIDVWRAAVAQRFDQWFGALNELGGQWCFDIILEHFSRFFPALP